MKLQYDRQLTISVGNSRKDMNWKPQTLTVGELWERLKVPARGTETISQYLALKKAQQDELKDVGGFMAGTLSGGRRKASAVTGRDVVTLDFDTIPAYGTEGVLKAADNLGCGYAVYSTRKHIETAPRLRLLFPLDRTVSADEYEPIARWMAAQIGIQMADPTTFEPSRLMYWPSCSVDSDFVFKYKDAPLVKADGVLNSYTDWRDFSSWPQVPGAVSYQRLATKQGDPDSKPGIVGAFNRAYGDVYTVMDKLLPGIYDPVDGDPNRFTYLGGSTTGGAVVYDNGKFLYSHHATDPCGGKLVNCFDLVRLHKFGEKDDEAAAGTPNNRLPSYLAMCEFAVADPLCSALMAKERHEEAMKDFDGVGADNHDDPANWMQKLDLNAKSGLVKPTIDNILIILDNDPMLKKKFALNQFAGRGEILGQLPWSNDRTRRLWSDTDSNGLYWYLEKAYQITGRGNIDAALDIHAATHAFNEVQDYIKGLEWDGVPRLDTLFIDYLGAEDDAADDGANNPHVQAVRKLAAESGSEVFVVCAQIEEEISELDDDEKQMFLEDLGLTESGLDKLIRASYSLLGLMSFLTAGEKETRAWTIKKGTKAPQAAGKIHTDFERGFIRAEVVNYKDLLECGSLGAAREKGIVRLEGKEYVVQDGDVILFRFNV